MFLHIVEHRRIPLPAVLVARIRDLQQFRSQTIDLQPLQAVHQRSGRWLVDLAGREPRYTEWRPQFGSEARVLVEPILDPADRLSEESDRSALALTFDPAALADLNRHLFPPQPAGPPAPWRLTALQFLIVRGSPLVNILSGFAPARVIPPGEYERAGTGLSLPFDHLWPVFMAVLEEARRRGPAGAWEGHAPFSLPPTFHRSGHPDFDPSEEIQYEDHVFLQGPTDQTTAWRSAAVSGDQKALPRPSAEGWRVHMGWGSTFWESEPTDPPPTPEQLLRRVGSVVLSGEAFKFLGLCERLYVALLDDAQSGRPGSDVPPDELRAALYRNQVRWQALSSRGYLMFEFERQYYETGEEVGDLGRMQESGRHLGELVLRLAEQKETAAILREERTLQAIGLWFTFLTLGALGMDLFNFLRGSTSDPEAGWPGTATRGVFLVALFASLLFLAWLALRSLFRPRGQRKG